MRVSFDYCLQIMAVSESSRLRSSLRKEGVLVKRLIVNQVLPPSSSDCKFCSIKRKVKTWWFRKCFLNGFLNSILMIMQDQMRALDMILDDQELNDLTMVKAPLVDVEIRGVPALRFMGDLVWK